MITIGDSTKATAAICENCRWWAEWKGDEYHPDETGKRMGNCVKKSPRIITAVDRHGNERTRTKWPSTAATEFCGDFKPPQPASLKTQPEMPTPLISNE